MNNLGSGKSFLQSGWRALREFNFPNEFFEMNRNKKSSFLFYLKDLVKYPLYDKITQKLCSTDKI